MTDTEVQLVRPARQQRSRAAWQRVLETGLRLLPETFARANHVLRIAGMYVLTLGGWLLFRVASMEQAGVILRNIATNFRVGPETGELALPVLVLTAMLFLFHAVQEREQDETLVLGWRPVARFALYVFLLVSAVSVGLTPQPFIYFQF